MDNTYMFFHPSFREWLIRREESESKKFVCDLRLAILLFSMLLKSHFINNYIIIRFV